MLTVLGERWRRGSRPLAAIGSRMCWHRRGRGRSANAMCATCQCSLDVGIGRIRTWYDLPDYAIPFDDWSSARRRCRCRRRSGLMNKRIEWLVSIQQVHSKILLILAALHFCFRLLRSLEYRLEKCCAQSIFVLKCLFNLHIVNPGKLRVMVVDEANVLVIAPWCNQGTSLKQDCYAKLRLKRS